MGSQTSYIICVQVAVKRMPTAQLPAEAFTEFTQYLQMVAFATRACKKLCLPLGFVVVEGRVCQVMQLYEESLQQLLSSCEGVNVLTSLCLNKRGQHQRACPISISACLEDVLTQLISGCARGNSAGSNCLSCKFSTCCPCIGLSISTWCISHFCNLTLPVQQEQVPDMSSLC